MFKRFRRNSALNRQDEEKLYEFISQEMKAGQIRQGLMTKAKVISKGNKDQTEAEYIKLRIQSIQDEYVIEEFLREIEKENYISEQNFNELIKKNSIKNKEKNIDDKDDVASELKVLFFFIVFVSAVAFLLYNFN